MMTLLTFLKESEAAAERRQNGMLNTMAQQNATFMEMFKETPVALAKIENENWNTAGDK